MKIISCKEALNTLVPSNVFYVKNKMHLIDWDLIDQFSMVDKSLLFMKFLINHEIYTENLHEENTYKIVKHMVYGNKVIMAKDNKGNVLNCISFDENNNIIQNQVFDDITRYFYVNGRIDFVNFPDCIATYKYDKDQLVSIDYVSDYGATTKIYKNGLLSEINYFDGFFQNYYYNDKNLLEKTKNSNGHEVLYFYNCKGLLYKTKTNSISEVIYEYDNDDNLVLSTDSFDSHQVKYKQGFEVASRFSQEKKWSNYLYDKFQIIKSHSDDL